MSSLLTAITTGVTTFAATNLDEFVILMLFFSQVNATLRPRHIVVGQYLGFTALVIASLPGFFSSFILPQSWIGLLGFVPIAIGLDRLLYGEEESDEVQTEIGQYQNSIFTSFFSPQTYTIAAVTVGSDGDNISVYMPLFANSNWESLLVIISVFFVLVGVLCYTAYRLTRQSAIADFLTDYGNILVPFVFIGLGIYILLESSTLSRLRLQILIERKIQLLFSTFFSNI